LAITAYKTGSYTNRLVYDLPSTADIKRFMRVWQRMARSHPILRTRIVPSGGGAVQVVVDDDLEWTRSNGKGTLANYLEEDETIRFSPGSPLARYALARETTTSSWTFVWTVHHAIYDGWTMKLLLEDMEKRYHQQQAITTTPYNHFIRHLASVDHRAAHDFWSAQLGGEGEAPSDFPALPNANYKPQPSSELNREILASIDQKTLRSLGVPLPSILRAVWGLVLASHLGSEDVLFAMVLAGRSAPVQGMTGIVGPTITTVPMRM
ncbi:condensation domain-containing protein, partial [Colletotrichum cereale]